MSVHVTSPVWKFGPTERNQKFILLALADIADDKGYCWPSIKTIAEYTLFSERYVLATIQTLEQDGWMRVDHRAIKGRYTAYQIDMEKLELLRDEARSEEKRRRSGAKSSPEITPKGDGSGAQSSPENSTSPEQSSPDRSISGEIRNTSEVKSATVSGEIRSTPILKNHHEPSSEPFAPVGANTETDFPDGLDPINYANAIVERCFIPVQAKGTGVLFREAIAECIRVLGRMESCETHVAAYRMEQRVKADQQRGVLISKFWFENGNWKLPEGGVVNGTTQGHRSAGAAGSAARVERALSAWDRVRAERNRARAVR